MKLAIYGAQAMALGAGMALRELYPQRAVECFLVTSMAGNEPKLMDIPVREIADFSRNMSQENKDDMEILLAVPEAAQEEIEVTLESQGFVYHQRLTSVRWAELMSAFYLRQRMFTSLEALPIGCRKPFMRVYAAQSAQDRVLQRSYVLPDWLVPIQAGAALSVRKTAAVRDEQGLDNISDKNGNYCELTALYWLWKNRLQLTGNKEIGRRHYYGLAQYRRLLALSEEDVLRLADNDVDVVLPYPMPYEPDISSHRRRYIKEADWEALSQAVSELQPGYARDWAKCQQQPYLYNYNIIIARKAVLAAYCEWLFPILARVEELSSPKGIERSDRYIGYMGESLETLYFLTNQSGFNIVHTGCRFLL